MSRPVPSELPLLRRGRHQDPREGSCLMEYVSVLAGERFSDRPRCTPPVLAWLAQRVNDGVSDTARTELVLRAPLLARACTADPTAPVLEAVARSGLALVPEDTWLLRARYRAEHTAVSWRRPLVRLCLLEAFLAHDRHLRTLSGPERDRRLISLLDTVLDALHPVVPVSAPRPVAS